MTGSIRLLFVFLATLVLATGVNAKSADKGGASIEVFQQADGMLFNVRGGDTDLQLDISGPGKAMYSKHYSYAESVFFNVNDASGVKLPDGLYKYEARPMPAVRISRAESSSMTDRNVLYGKTDAKLSPVSGTFRIVNGGVVDPNINEFDTPIQLPAETVK